MKRAGAILDESAFVGLVLSSTEVYKKECYGALLGCAKRGVANIREAVPYQSARRKPTSVEIVETKRCTVASVMRSMPRHDYLGEYHSHVGFGDDEPVPSISDEDLVGIRDGEIEVIIAVRKRSSRRPWRHNSDGTLSGVAGPYHLTIRAYRVERTDSRCVAHPVVVRCRYAATVASSRRELRRRALQPGP